MSKRAHINTTAEKPKTLQSVLETIAACRKNSNLEAWREELKAFCPPALEDEEMAGRVVRLIEEYKRRVQIESVIPAVGCGDEVLDLCLLEGMVCLGRIEEALSASENSSDGKL